MTKSKLTHYQRALAIARGDVFVGGGLRRYDEALAAVERLEAETKRLELLSIEMAVKRDFANLEVDRLQTRVGELEASALNSSGDNLCWLIETADVEPRKIPPREEFLESCRRFHAQISGQGGELAGCKTIAQLETENTLLRAERQSDTDTIKKLLFSFLSLPYHTRKAIMQRFGLMEAGDDSLPEVEVFTACFDRARQRNVLSEVWDAVAREAQSGWRDRAKEALRGGTKESANG